MNSLISYIKNVLKNIEESKNKFISKDWEKIEKSFPFANDGLKNALTKNLES